MPAGSSLYAVVLSTAVFVLTVQLMTVGGFSEISICLRGIFHFLQRRTPPLPYGNTGVLGWQEWKHSNTSVAFGILEDEKRKGVGEVPLLDRQTSIPCANFSRTVQVTCDRYPVSCPVHFLRRIILWSPKGWWELRCSSSLSPPLHSGPVSQMNGARKSWVSRAPGKNLLSFFCRLLPFTMLNLSTAAFSSFVLFVFGG